MDDTKRIEQLAAMLKACPHARITWNDDPDREDADGDVPLGYSIRIDGCEPLIVSGPDFRGVIEAACAPPEGE